MNPPSEHQPAQVPATDKQAGEDPWQRHGAERAVWTESMLMALERGLKGNKWFSLIDKVATDRTLGIGWQKVQFNAGACGVDGMTVGHFAKDSDKRLLTLREQLREGRYQPQPIRRVHIPKAGSKERRPLGIPTVRDRIVQSAVKAVIEPIFESKFAPNSYGFYPSLRRVLRRGFAKCASASRRGSDPDAVVKTPCAKSKDGCGCRTKKLKEANYQKGSSVGLGFVARQGWACGLPMRHRSGDRAAGSVSSEGVQLPVRSRTFRIASCVDR